MSWFRAIVVTVLLFGLAGFSSRTSSQENRRVPPNKPVPGDPSSDPFDGQPTNAPERPTPKKNAERIPLRPNDTATELPVQKFPSLRVESPTQSAARRRIERVLEMSDKFQYPQAALADVVHEISQRFAIPVILQKKALEDAGVGTDTQVDVDLLNVSLRAALTIILDEHDLTYMIKDEVLVITTHDDAENCLFTTVFNISCLKPKQSERIVFRKSGHGSDLVNVITNSIAADTWSSAGGTGSIELVDDHDLLVVSQTETVTIQVENLLGTLKQIVDAKAPAQAANIETPANEMIVKIYDIVRLDNALKGSGAQQTGQVKNTSAIRMAQFGGGTPKQESADRTITELRAKAFDVDGLAAFIPTIIEPDTWGGTKGTIAVFGEHLIVRNFPRVHQQVGQLLADLDLLKPPGSSSQRPVVHGFGGAGGEGGGLFSVRAQQK